MKKILKILVQHFRMKRMKMMKSILRMMNNFLLYRINCKKIKKIIILLIMNHLMSHLAHYLKKKKLTKINSKTKLIIEKKKLKIL